MVVFPDKPTNKMAILIEDGHFVLSEFRLDREALAAAAGTAGVGVDEVEPLALQATAPVQLGASQVEIAFQVGAEGHPFVLEDLIHRLGFVIKVKLIAQARASAADDGYAQGELARQSRFLAQTQHLVAGGV